MDATLDSHDEQVICLPQPPEALCKLEGPQLIALPLPPGGIGEQRLSYSEQSIWNVDISMPRREHTTAPGA